MFRTHSRSLHFATVTLITSLYRHLLVPMSLKLVRIHRKFPYNLSQLNPNVPQLVPTHRNSTRYRRKFVPISSDLLGIQCNSPQFVSPPSKMFLDLPSSLLRHHSMSHTGLKILPRVQFNSDSLPSTAIQPKIRKSFQFVSNSTQYVPTSI